MSLICAQRRSGTTRQGSDGSGVQAAPYALRAWNLPSSSLSIVDRATGKEGSVKAIMAPLAAKFGDALLGVEYLGLANEGAGCVSIAKLVELLRRAQAAVARPVEAARSKIAPCQPFVSEWATDR